MGRRGPPPTPTRIKMLRGNPGKRPLNNRPIGWPKGRYGRPPRRPIDECLHWERVSEA